MHDDGLHRCAGETHDTTPCGPSRMPPGLPVETLLVRGENGAAGAMGYLPIGGDPLRAGSCFLDEFCGVAEVTALPLPPPRTLSARQ
jgi:hypothetical protein